MELFKNFDFKVEIDNAKVLFNYFFNEVTMSLVLLCISLIYILVAEKDKKIKDIFFWYILLLILVIWNPIFIYFVGEFVNFGSMYRFYYMIPMYPIIAYTFTKIISSFNKNWVRLLGVIVICGIAIVFGRNVYDDWNLLKFNNFYKLPDDTVFVAETIYKDDKYKDKKAIVPYGMSSQIQQIYSSIDLAYTRIVSNHIDENGKLSPYDTDDPGDNELIRKFYEGDTEYIVDFCNRENINYIVFYDSIQLQRPLDELGFESIKSGCGVTIYRKV